MATFQIVCDSPLHQSRALQPDWSNNLGTADRPVTGYKCPACARLDPPDPKGVNKLTLVDRATLGLATNNTFLAIANPTNAQILAQTRALTKEYSSVIRLLLDQLDDISGT